MIWQPEFTDKILSRKPGAVHDKCPPGDLFVDGSPDVVHQLVTQRLRGVIVIIISVMYRHDREGLSGLLIERERVRNMDVQRGGDRAVNRHLFE